MNRKHVLTILRIVVSVALVVCVCSKIRLNDTLVKADGSQVAGRLLPDEKGPEKFGIRADAGTEVHLTAADLQKDKEGRLTGVNRGIITVFRDLNLWWFIPAFLFIGIAPSIGAIRFRMLLAVQDVKISVARAFKLTFLGNFFNNFMLGLTGGDVIKAYYVARETHKRTEAVVTVFLDRIVGLVALALLAAAMVAANFRDPKFAGAALYIWIFLVGACFVTLTLYSRLLRQKVHYTVLGVFAVGGGLIMWFHVAHKGWEAARFEIWAYFAALALIALFALIRPLRLLFQLHRVRLWFTQKKIVREMDATFHTFSRKPLTSVLALVISFGGHLVSIMSAFGFARALGIHAEFHYFLVFIPVIVMIAAIPVSMAGWGVQEAVFQVFFGSVGVGATEAITLSFIYRLCAAILWSLPGGIVLMLSKDRASAQEVERAMAAEDKPA